MAKDRILVTHAGVLPRSEPLRDMVQARADAKPYDAAALGRLLAEETAAVVRRQVATGIDSVNDGELGKTNFTNYVSERIAGFERREHRPGKDPAPLNIMSRDAKKFGAYFATGHGGFAFMGSSGGNMPFYQVFCTAPLRYVGAQAVASDIANFKAALKDAKAGEAFLSANTPGTIEHWLRNEHYKSDEEFLTAIAEVMREEYEAIVNAGLLLQIDDPDLPDGWQMYPEMSVAQYRKYAALRVEALNHALRNIPREKIRLHVCWGSFHGPHQADIPLADIVDIIFSVKASSYSIEASNPCHEHEWQVFKDFKLPAGAVLIPGVVGHATDFIEHPALVAERLQRYAGCVGRENVMASTDCGLGYRVGHASIVWAKLEAMVEGARLATKQLWGKE
jgi:5-methyltetrahydropteroyltriglutamate--homocysteine methyltransferase